jgi:thioredoxin-related protein
VLGSIVLMSTGWRTDFEKAKQAAKAENKLVLLKFSGSDWCVPCRKMEKDVFSQNTFAQYADKNLVMVNADFPRQKKNALGKEQIKQNEALAEQYDKQGHFPYTLLLSPDGKVLMAWDGYKDKPEDLINDIKKVKE